MNKSASTILFILSVIFAILTVIGTAYAICDITRISNDLTNDLAASGVDFMGIGWGYGIVLFALSAIVLILSAVSIKLLSNKALRYTAVAEVILSAVLIVASVFIFYV
jgi:hypothetical protein